MDAQKFIDYAYENRKLGKGWKIEQTKANPTGFQIKNPANMSHPPFSSKTEWIEAFNKFDNKTARLWIFSLDYITDLHKVSPDLAYQVLDSFSEAYKELHKSLSVSLKGSWDHCLAVRLKALVTLVGSGDERIGERAARMLETEHNLENLWDLVQKNNHGLMLAESLIYAGIATGLKNQEAGLAELKTGTIKIKEILDRIFGNDFYCGENTPFYHRFYIQKLQAMVDRFANVPSLKPLQSHLKYVADQASETMKNIVFQDGTVPGMGDANAVQSGYESRNGTHWSTRTGFWVWKSQKLYLSFKCGHDTIIHKHADDTSIVVRYGGEDFILDAGNASFNYSDPRILMLRTQRGHSGVYFEKFDHLHPANLYTGIYSNQGKLISPSKDSVRGSYDVGGNHFAYRKVSVVDEKNFTLQDWAASVEGAPVVHRFLVHPSISISEESNAIILIGNKANVHIFYSESLSFELTEGQEEAPHKGWASLKPFRTVPAKCLEFRSSKIDPQSVLFRFEIREK